MVHEASQITLTAIAPIPHDCVAPVSAADAPTIGPAAGTAQAASEALATLDVVRHSGSDGGKARAAARIVELKTRLQLLHADDAENLAQAATQTRREAGRRGAAAHPDNGADDTSAK